jgi:hypothetical protein
MFIDVLPSLTWRACWMTVDAGLEFVYALVCMDLDHRFRLMRLVACITIMGCVGGWMTDGAVNLLLATVRQAEPMLLKFGGFPIGGCVTASTIHTEIAGVNIGLRMAVDALPGDVDVIVVSMAILTHQLCMRAFKGENFRVVKVKHPIKPIMTI